MVSDSMNFREQAEEELLLCTEEINMLYNKFVSSTKEKEKLTLLKSLLLLLYAHYEGFTNFLLQSYVQEINLKNLKRKDVREVLVVASMEKIFKDYDNLDKKNGYFKRAFPDESALHRYIRRADLLAQINDFLEKTLKIEDGVINTESNLHVEVLEKNLYKLGIDLTLSSFQKGIISRLLKIRNDIAHTGSHKMLLKTDSERETEIREIKGFVFDLMQDLIEKIYIALENKEYLKK